MGHYERTYGIDMVTLRLDLVVVVVTGSVVTVNLIALNIVMLIDCLKSLMNLRPWVIETVGQLLASVGYDGGDAKMLAWLTSNHNCRS